MRQPRKHRNDQTNGVHPVFSYRPPKYLSSAKWAAIAAGAVFLLCAIYVAFWFFMAGQLRDGTMAWIEEQRNAGLAVNFKTLDIGGFPFSLQMTVDGPTIAAPKSSARWGWEGEKVRASMRLWRPDRVTINAPGNHAFVFAINGGIQHFRGFAEQLNAALTLGDRSPMPLEANIAGLTLDSVQTGDIWRVGQARINVLAPQASAEKSNVPTLDVRFRMGDFSVPARLELPLGADVERLEISAELMGAIAGGPLEEALSGWRDDGGVIEVQRFSLAYGPVSLTADGTMALDRALQPIGSFTARIEGFFEAVDALRTRGIIKARDAITAKMVLGVMARRSGNGRAGLNIPLTVQQRQLFAGPVPLAKIPEIIW
ncbi:MAG: DUF2125 domain-containing protein [Rhodospirillales bacterium]|nr:DUF2125 domain-containing protein [Rhodospirillales bacterium]